MISPPGADDARAAPPAAGGPGGGQAAAPAAAMAGEIRRILVAVTGRAELQGITADTPLFGPGVALDSLTGTLLLRAIRGRFGVDVAAEDLNLDALATLGTLAAFLGERAGPAIGARRASWPGPEEAG